MMDLLIESLNDQWQGLVNLLPRLIAAIFILLASIVVGRIWGKAVYHLISRGQLSTTHKNFFRSLASWIFILLGAVLALSVLGFEGIATSLVAGGGATAIILGFAFREVGENLLAGLFLAFNRPFELGDLIQSGDLQGTVRSIDLRSTHVRSGDGRDIFIPSSQIFNSPLINYTRDGLRRISFTVGIDYADDSENARHILLEATRTVPGVEPDPPALVNMSALKPSFVEIEVSFWLDSFRKGTNLNEVRNNVMECCRRALMSNRFTVSSNATSNVGLKSVGPIELHLSDRDR